MGFGISIWKNKYSKFQEPSKENILLNEFALGSFDFFVNDFENQILISMIPLSTYNAVISQKYTNFMNIINTSFRVAFYFNKSDEKPKLKEVKEFLEEVISINETKHNIFGEESIFIDLLEDIKKESSKIAIEKIKNILPHKEEWINKNKLLKEYMNQLEKK